MVCRIQEEVEFGFGFERKVAAVIEAREHIHHHFVQLLHFGNGFLLVEGDFAFALAGGVDQHGVFQILGDPDVIHHQPTYLVAKDAVDAGNGLHQRVPVHRFIHVHGVQAGCIEAGQEHIAYDDQPQGVFGIFQAVADGFAALFVADVLLPVERVAGGAGHDDFDATLVVFGVVPIRAQLGDFLVQFHADAAAHADDHAFAVRRAQALIEVLDNVGGDLLQAAGATHHGFLARPFGKAPLAVGQFVVFGDFFHTLIQQFLVGF